MASGAILTGGEARRFGRRDKGQLIVEGRTILERQLDALSPIVHDLLLVGAPPPAHLPVGCRVIADATPGRGPLGGIDAALRATDADAVIVLACDMPYVTTALLAELLSQADRADAVVPRTTRGFHPLCAVYRQRCRTAIARRLAAGALAVQALLQDLDVHVVEPEMLARVGAPERLLANVNTPADLDDLQRLPSHKQ